MENIIILILFTYPGAMADFIHSRIVSGKQYDHKPEEYFRVARDFFLSALISMASIWAYCGITGQKFGISTAVERLKADESIILFMGITIIGAALAAMIWAMWDSGKFGIRNGIRAKSGKTTFAREKSVWKTLMTDADIPFNKCVLAFYQDGKLIRAGIPHTVSDDYEKDPWAILMWTETARMDLERPEEERSLLISPTHSFVNFENGISMDVYDGSAFYDFICEKVEVAEQERERREQAAAEE